MSFPLHSREAERLALLRELDLFDNEAPQPGLDAIAAGAARLTGVPIALVTLIGADEQRVLARYGVDLKSSPRAHAFCAHTILGDTLVEVPDLRRDARFRDNPQVAGRPHVRFYAGQPLAIDGLAVGSLCLLDVAPRELSDDDREALVQLGRAAVELLLSRQRLRDVERERGRLVDFARAGGDWMWESDAEHRYRWISDAFEAATGMSVAEQVGRTISDVELLDADGAPRVPALRYRQLLERQEPFARVVTPKRTPRGVRLLTRSAVPVFDAGGRFAGYRGTVRDVTTVITAAAEARRGALTLRQLAEQVPGVLFIFEQRPDGSAAYPFVSDGAERHFGMPAALLQTDANAFFSRVHPQDLAGLVQAIGSAAGRGVPLEHTYRLQPPDGLQRWVETRAAPTRLPDGGTLWHGFTADVSARRAADEALQAHEERWQMAADAAGIGIAQLTLADGRVRFDQRACANHGLSYPQLQFTLTDWVAQIDPVDRDAARAGIERAIHSGVPFDGRYRIHRPDGSLRWLEFLVRATHDDAGAATGVIGICRDVHEQQIATDLHRGKQEAERASRAKSEFLSRVSHELRTPLNGILGFAQLMTLDREHALTGAQAQRLASVQRAGRHLLDLINDVLELSRIESSVQSVQAVPVEVDAVLRAGLQLVQPLAAARAVGLKPAPPSGAWVRGDARAVEQVLVNLLSNAIKYSPEGGAVAIEVEGLGDEVAIHVRDHGAGLSAEQQSRLFQPFDRLGAEQRRIEGSGLGLVIARQLAELMDGRIEVRSRPGSGSTFSLRLAATAPVEAPPARAAEAEERVAIDDGPTSDAPRRVVYIEDEPLNQMLLQEVFRARPAWRLHVADDGASGLRQVRELAPDLVLVDMNLPDTNGLALVAALRADPATRGLRCIALSADAMEPQIAAARTAGFDDYWTKPIDVGRVLAQLDGLLGAD